MGTYNINVTYSSEPGKGAVEGELELTSGSGRFANVRGHAKIHGQYVGKEISDEWSGTITDLGADQAEGMAVTEAFRGDVLIWLRIANGVVERCHMRDASWFQWPLLEAVIEGNIVADFPLCNKSFNCSYSGHDL